MQYECVSLYVSCLNVLGVNNFYIKLVHTKLCYDFIRLPPLYYVINHLVCS